MYQTRKLMRTGLSLALLAAAMGLAIPKYAKATPVNQTAFLGGEERTQTGSNIADTYTSFVFSGSGLATTLNTGTWNYLCPATTCVGYGVSGSGSEKVDAGVLGAQSNVSVSGTQPIDNGDLALSSAAFVDYLTITGGSGSGVLALTWTIDGSINNSNGFNESYGWLQVGGEYSFINGVYSSLDGGTPSLGYAQYPQSNATVNFWIPFTYGTQFSLSQDLSTVAVFEQALNTTPYTAQANFYDTATLTSALVYDGTMSSNGPSGSLVDDATILSGDGFSYGPDGLSMPSAAVPEPGELPWFALGLGFLGLIIARRRLQFRKRFPR